MITILIADDHRIVADGLSLLLETQPDFRVIGCVADGVEAIRASQELHPDLLLMDNAMPLMNGIEAMREILDRCPGTKVIILSMYADTVHVRRAFEAGASGYLDKKSVGAEVVEAIRQVHGGRRFTSPELSEQILDILSGATDPADLLGSLSSRERQVLQMLAEGHSVASIAETLMLSPKTVETYRSRIMAKLDIHDLAGLVRFAIREGLVILEKGPL